MKKFISFLSVFALLNVIVSSVLDIEYGESVRQEYSKYFNTTLDSSKRNHRISLNENSPDAKLLLIEYKLWHMSIFDLRQYYYSIEKLTFFTTDQGVFFPKSAIREILRFIYSTKNNEVITTDIGFLHLNNIVIDGDLCLNIKMQHIFYDETKFRGLLLNPVEIRVLTSALNAFDNQWSSDKLTK